MLIASRAAAPAPATSRRLRLAALSIAAALVATFSAQAQPVTQPAPAGDVVGVGNFVHIVADLDKSLAFAPRAE